MTRGSATLYVGECSNLSIVWKRIGRLRPASVHARGGHQTHCRINTAILNEDRRMKRVTLWFHAVEGRLQRRAEKKKLIDALQPPWNTTSWSRLKITPPESTAPAYNNFDDPIPLDALSQRIQVAIPRRMAARWADGDRARGFEEIAFSYVGAIRPDQDEYGWLVELRPQRLRNVHRHNHGDGPFCRFSIAKDDRWKCPGVYVLADGRYPLYVGKSKNLLAIWNQIGRLSQFAVRVGGQQTHCRINASILHAVKEWGTNTSSLQLWFHSIYDEGERSRIKEYLVAFLKPPWNMTRANRSFSSKHWRIEGPILWNLSKESIQFLLPWLTRKEDGYAVMERRLAFHHVGTLKPKQDASGAVVEDVPFFRYHKRERLKPHREGLGPFCKFRIAQERQWRMGGVYVLAGHDSILYVGQTSNLQRRWERYGNISPSDCYFGRQTNCRLNNLILQGSKNGVSFHLWFARIEGSKEERLDIEMKMLGALRPPLNMDHDILWSGRTMVWRYNEINRLLFPTPAPAASAPPAPSLPSGT